MDHLIDTDIAIVGAGVAGCIAALALAPTYRVLLLDRAAVPAARVGECLPGAARRIFRKLGLPCPFAVGDGVHLTSHGMRVQWGGDRVQTVDHLRNPDGPSLHLDRPAFERSLRQQAVAAGARLLCPARAGAATAHDTGWSLAVTDHPQVTQVRAAFVVDATGRRARFAGLQGATRLRHDRLTACWATLPDVAGQALGTLAAAPDGWWYSAPLPQRMRVLCFQTDSDLMPRGLHKDPRAFAALARAQPVMAPFLEAASDLCLHGMVPAESACLDTPAGPRWAAIGDAATSFDPLSSQGMFNAMAGAMQLADTLQAHGRVNDAWDGEGFAAAFTAQIHCIRQHYLAHKDHYYRQERRYVGHPFWQRRLAGAPVTPAL